MKSVELKKYRVLLRGENFLLASVDKKRKCGFYSTFWVEAKNEKEAELNAVELVRRQKDLQIDLLNSKEDQPMIYLDEIYELNSDAEIKEISGRTYFIESEEFDKVKYSVRKKWWEFWK